MITLTDDRLDFEIMMLLQGEAEDLHGAPDAMGMSWLVATADDRSRRRRFERAIARPTVRMAIIGLLMAAVFGIALVVGASRWGVVENGLIVLQPYRAIDPATGLISDTAQCGGRCPKAADVAWSRDGREMIFVEDNRPFADRFDFVPGWTIWRYNEASDDLALIYACPPSGSCGRLSYSVDGRSIALIEHDETQDAQAKWHVVSINLSTGKRRQVERADSYFGTAWTADGRILTSVTDDPAAEETRGILFDPATGDATELVTPWPYARVGVSADGSMIALARYVRRAEHHNAIEPNRAEEYRVEFWLANIDGTDLRRVYSATGQVLSPPVWAPDGRKVALALVLPDDTSGLFTIDIATGDVRRAELPDWYAGALPVTAWLPAN